MSDRQGVQSIETGMALLRGLTAGDGLMPLKDLAAAAGMAPAKAHRYLVSLMRAGMVEQDRDSGHYRLGAGALNVGLAALRGLDVMRHAGAALDDLRAATGHTALLAVWSDRGPVVVRWDDAPRPIATNIRVGSMMPLLNSSTGRVFSAWLPDDLTRPILDAEAADHPDFARGHAKLLTEVRAQGLARVAGDLLPGIAALSAPVFDWQGDLAAVLSILGHTDQFDASYDGETATALRRISGDLTARLGGQAPAPAVPSRP